MKTEEIAFDKAVQLLKPFSKKKPLRASWQFFSTFIFLWLSLFFSFYFFTDTPWIVFLTIPSTVIFMCRSYVLEHDAGHQNLFRSPHLNNFVGNLCGFGIMIPFSMWKLIHNSHHTHVGNLDKRDSNPEVWTMTVKEFNSSSRFKRSLYRFMRSKFGRLIITPTLNFGIAGRLIHPKYSRNAIISVLFHNVVYGLFFWLLIYKFGWLSFILCYVIPLILFFGVAAFSLYGQHQFEQTYWKRKDDWSWKTASMFGSTNLQAPFWFRWLVGNVVHHTAHHVNPNIPNFKLHKAQLLMDETFEVNKIPINEVWNWLGLALWDEEQQKLVPIKNASK